MFRARIASAAMCMALSCACTNSAGESSKANLEEHANYFLPEDATDVVTAPELPWLQKSFNVSREPLEFAVSVEKLNHAMSEGWKLCEPSDREWKEFDDATFTPPRHTRQRVYVLSKDGVLAVLIGMYYTEIDGRSQAQVKMNQHGILIVRNATEQEAQETAQSFNLKCL